MHREHPSAVAIIPARLDSTRFPEKALADDTGKPLVVHVCERASTATMITRVVVATDSRKIKDAVEAHGFEAVMTAEHPNGTSRLAEAAKKLNLKEHHVVVNVQGDEPEIEPAVIDAAITALSANTEINRAADTSPGVGERFQMVGTVASPIEDPSDPNEVKVVLDLIEPDSGAADALYFSRAPVPYKRSAQSHTRYFRHVGIYAYTVGALDIYLQLSPTPLEQAESLEQLRWLEHGYPIGVAVRESTHAGIDTPEQYAAFVDRFRATKN